MKFKLIKYLIEDKQLRDSKDVFDITKQELPYYQEYLRNPNYANKRHNTISEIKQMSANEYFKELEKIFPGTTAESQKRYMNNKEERKIIDSMKDTILNTNKKLPMTYLNYSYTPSQEGRHRMVAVGELYGWDEKFPVLVINWTEEQKNDYEMSEISELAYKAINKSLQSRYIDYDQFLEDLRYQVENILRDNDKQLQKYRIKETNSTFILDVNGTEHLIEKDDIILKDKNDTDDDFDWIDTLDMKDIDKLLKDLPFQK